MVLILQHACTIPTIQRSHALVLGRVQVAAAPVRVARGLVRIARDPARAVRGARAAVVGLVVVKQKLKHAVVKDMNVGSAFRSFFLSNKMSELFPIPSPPPSPSSAVLDHVAAWVQVMRDLLIATHCHSCGASMNVCLIGYCGAHCTKMCWKMNEFELMEDFECMWGDDCAICTGSYVSLARSARSRGPHDGWPMSHRLCTNTAIASRPPVSVTHHCDSE